jgi:hypothetical protein
MVSGSANQSRVTTLTMPLGCTTQVTPKIEVTNAKPPRMTWDGYAYT